jgi:hypothetical protein
MVLDGVPNDNKIAWNLNHHQFISKIIYHKIFFSIYLKICCQDYQNNLLSSDPPVKKIYIHDMFPLKEMYIRKIIQLIWLSTWFISSTLFCNSTTHNCVRHIIILLLFVCRKYIPAQRQGTKFSCTLNKW